MKHPTITIGSDYGGLEKVLVFHGPTRWADAEDRFNTEVTAYIDSLLDKPVQSGEMPAMRQHLMNTGELVPNCHLYHRDGNGSYIRLHRDVEVTNRGG